MTAKLTGPWKKTLAKTRALAVIVPMAIDSSLRDEAFAMRRIVVQGFRKGGVGSTSWARLRPVTLAIRKLDGHEGSKPLVRSGDLRQSVTVRKVGHASYFVGVHKSARSSSGKPLVNIAAIHEGPMPTVIPVTAGVRRFFMYLFMSGAIAAPLSKSRRVLVIMPRPFLRPAFEKIGKGFDARMSTRIAAYLAAAGIAEGRALKIGASSASLVMVR